MGCLVRSYLSDRKGRTPRSMKIHLPPSITANSSWVINSDRDAVKLIVMGSRGTRYEAFVETIASRNTANIGNAVKKSKENHIEGIKEETLAILMEEYIATLFRLVTSDRDKETIINCMEMIGRVYETGITNLMKKER